jgi:LacI family transcriptional regulator
MAAQGGTVEGKTDRGTTILDVARLAGVSPSTVTHTLNGKRPIGQETRERVLKAIESLGYVPSRSAQGLRGGSSGIIGCLAVDITETFVNQIVRGIEKGLPGSGLTLLFASGVEFGKNFDEAFTFLKGHRIDGLLICHPFPMGEVRRPLETSRRTPMVSINMEIPGMASVVPDNVRGGFQAAEHLYGAGMRRPAMICGPRERLSVTDRLKGFRERIVELGLELAESAVLFGEYSFDHGFAATRRLMDLHPDTDGIFCANDYIAAGAVARLGVMGIEIPRQVRVVGFDNRDFSSFEPVPLTTFEQPLQEMGLLGMGILRCAIDSKDGQGEEPTHVLQSKLIPRASTMGRGNAPSS